MCAKQAAPKHDEPADTTKRKALQAIVALIAVARRASYPQALMKPYRKGER